jgi:hypothetical protein
VATRLDDRDDYGDSNNGRVRGGGQQHYLSQTEARGKCSGKSIETGDNSYAAFSIANAVTITIIVTFSVARMF